MGEPHNKMGGDGIRRDVRCAVVLPVVRKRAEKGAPPPLRSADAQLEEACGLAASIDLDIVLAEQFDISRPRPATLIGSGKLSELAERIVSEEIELVVVDHPLTPVQQRNLEKELKAKVLDRTGLILEIFGRRAQTREGVLQVELAHLTYQKGRLVRSWTHLERQRGGAGFLGGPGETQIETDRRLLQDKIDRLRKDLEKVRQTRQLHRQRRESVPHPVVALVGYTNAGKSTLFNRVTGAGVHAQDQLFATLDPTLRRLTLPHGTRAILSDTVGFIANLPTQLVAAFRATLEEVQQASLILHVRDVASPEAQAQGEDVLDVLSELGVLEGEGAIPIVEVWNKVDLLAQDVPEALPDPLLKPLSDGPVVRISAVTGFGLDALMTQIELSLSGSIKTYKAQLGPNDLRHLDDIHRLSRVISRKHDKNGGMKLELAGTDEAIERLRRLPGLEITAA